MVLTRPFGWRSTLMQFIPLRHFLFLDRADSTAETACHKSYPGRKHCACEKMPSWKIDGEENKLKVVAAGPVSRILSAGLLQQDGHSSGPDITAWLKRPTRRL